MVGLSQEEALQDQAGRDYFEDLNVLGAKVRFVGTVNVKSKPSSSHLNHLLAGNRALIPGVSSIEKHDVPISSTLQGHRESR